MSGNILLSKRIFLFLFSTKLSLTGIERTIDMFLGQPLQGTTPQCRPTLKGQLTRGQSHIGHFPSRSVPQQVRNCEWSSEIHHNNNSYKCYISKIKN